MYQCFISTNTVAPGRTERKTRYEQSAKKFRKLHEYSAEQDIRYRGPLSYQRLMALGWLMIVFAAVRLLANHPVDLNQLDQWLEMIKFPGS